MHLENIREEQGWDWRNERKAEEKKNSGVEFNLVEYGYTVISHTMIYQLIRGKTM